jgi:1-piperideine-2-carboxylate/1-pyrroline-2-carboxylate reductase [NAD(P)H]
MKILDAAQTAQALPYPVLVDALKEVLLDVRRGMVTAPPRQAIALGGGATLLLMPAAGPDLAITKLVTVHPANVGGPLPVVQGEVVVLDANTGERLGILEGATATARRTAAVTLLAARQLAIDPAPSLLIVGAGVQARAHLEALAEGLTIRQVFITARTFAHAQSLALWARGLGVDAKAVANPAFVLDYVRLIITATSSSTPVLPENVADGTFIAAIGAYTPAMAELPAGLVRRAHLYVDTLEGAQAEAGDLLQACVDWATVTPLDAITEQARPTDGVTIFKSVGHAFWDLAVARAAFGTSSS